MTDLINIAFNGSHGSTTFTDTSGKIWTPHGAAQLDANNKREGTASGDFHNNVDDDYIYAADHADFNIANSDFTFDFIFNGIGVGGEIGTLGICGQWQEGNTMTDNSFYIYISKKSMYFIYSDGSITRKNFSAQNVNIFPDTWNHAAFVRYGNLGLIYFNGYLVGQGSITATIPNSTRIFTIGVAGLTSGGSGWTGMYGRLDAFRFTNSARWTGDRFDPPSGPYINYIPKIVFSGE